MLVENTLIEPLTDFDGRDLLTRFMFDIFTMQPLNGEELKRICNEKLPLKVRHHKYFCEEIYSKLFEVVHAAIWRYTQAVGEYEYFLSYLYPYFTKQITDATFEEFKRATFHLNDRNFKLIQAELIGRFFKHEKTPLDRQAQQR